MRRKCSTTVGDNRIGNAMEFTDVANVELGYVLGGGSVMAGIVIGLFSKAIHSNRNGLYRLNPVGR